jgi:RNA polymerase sigma factor (TIGR02999 family)
MRRVLIDHARARSSLKRGNGWSRVTLQDGLTPLSSRGAADVIEVIHFDRVLAQLEQQHERMGRVAEMRLFGGMTMDEIAEALGVSKRTVEGDWSFARRWLGAALDGDRPTDAEGDSTNRGT